MAVHVRPPKYLNDKSSVSVPYWHFREFPTYTRLGFSFLVLLGSLWTVRLIQSQAQVICDAWYVFPKMAAWKSRIVNCLIPLSYPVLVMISLFEDFSVKDNLMVKNRLQIVKDFSDILQKHGMMLLLGKKISRRGEVRESWIVAQNKNVIQNGLETKVSR